MPRASLDRKIQNLLNEILVMDSMVEDAIIKSVDALAKHDFNLARTTYDFDKQINARRFELENDVIVTIATEQPIMAGDLRLMASILEVVGELERIGDYAKGIAKICLLIGNQPHVKPLIDIPLMCKLTVDMLNRAVAAFVRSDVKQAQKIPAEDDQVDALYVQVYRELVQIMIKDPTTIDQSNHLMWAAHNLERMADRVTNICERAIYVATGKLVEIESSPESFLLYERNHDHNNQP
jgi:phosphate transport system protein